MQEKYIAGQIMLADAIVVISTPLYQRLKRFGSVAMWSRFSEMRICITA